MSRNVPINCVNCGFTITYMNSKFAWQLWQHKDASVCSRLSVRRAEMEERARNLEQQKEYLSCFSY